MKFVKHITDNEADETIRFFAHLKNESHIDSVLTDEVLVVEKIRLYCVVQILETSYLFTLNRFDNTLFTELSFCV